MGADIVARVVGRPEKQVKCPIWILQRADLADLFAQVIPVRLLVSRRPRHLVVAVFGSPAQHALQDEFVPSLLKGSNRRVLLCISREIVQPALGLVDVKIQRALTVNRRKQTHRHVALGLSKVGIMQKSRCIVLPRIGSESFLE